MTEMLKAYQNHIVEQSQQIYELNNPSLASYIQFELEAWMEHQSFFNVFLKEFPPKENEEITSLMKQMQSHLSDIHKEMFYRVYGEKITPYLTDLKIMFEGIMKEYHIYFAVHNKEIEPTLISHWIADNFDAMVQQLEGKDPLLSPEHPEKIDDIFSRIQTLIHDNLKGKEQTEQFEALQLLKDEYNKAQPNRVCLEALLQFMKKHKLIQIELIKLERLFQREGI
ncbi:TetR family transcriptional regulator [Gracilibacillus halophilus YIM-C55.5]|uniref:TetR family transcriptional regulator n=1 Tax=Gracilibacillus halophilus YIM-C55.5 TaxID=1308866 RepID=N4W850_9BACI|nr:hypothetical protein [Gracilibacillus halophilus]ENH96448.1 TetR family transcriptional regulator [Gracilibacillus halophilus YIM-C55.5]